jgi:hypothetical protein
MQLLLLRRAFRGDIVRKGFFCRCFCAYASYFMLGAWEITKKEATKRRRSSKGALTLSSKLLSLGDVFARGANLMSKKSLILLFD